MPVNPNFNPKIGFEDPYKKKRDTQGAVQQTRDQLTPTFNAQSTFDSQAPQDQPPRVPNELNVAPVYLADNVSNILKATDTEQAAINAKGTAISSYERLSGLDPMAPIRTIQEAQQRLQEANNDMGTASQIQPSFKRALAGGAIGAIGGALGGGQFGAEMGRTIVDAPKNQAMGLAERRAKNAQGQIENAGKMSGAMENANQMDVAQHGEQRATETAKANVLDQNADREQRGQEMNNPEAIGGEMVQTPKFANGPAPIARGSAPPKTPVQPHYSADASGNQIAITGDKAAPVTDEKGQPVGSAPKQDNASFAEQYMTSFIKDHPKATGEQIRSEMLKFQGASAQAGRDAVNTQQSQSNRIVAGIISDPDVQAAISSGDENAYNKAVERELANISAQAPSFRQYLTEARTELQKSTPKAKAKKTPAEMYMERSQQGQRGTNPTK